MALSAEAIIALVALLITCILSGIGFAVQNQELLRQWWSRGTSTGDSALALPVHQPNDENQENDQLDYTAGSHINDSTNQPYLPLPSTAGSSQHHLGQSSIFDPFYALLQRYPESANRGQSVQRLETGLFFFTRVFDTGRNGENEPLTGGSTDGASASREELHQLV